jgi:hypothetical protein
MKFKMNWNDTLSKRIQSMYKDLVIENVFLIENRDLSEIELM